MHLRKYSKNEHSLEASGNALNIIIPIGGIGSRFSKEGYRYPKPLINIVGRPMILRLIDNLSLKSGDTLWMAVNEEIDDEFRLGQLIMKTFPRLEFKFLILKHQTRGASETVCCPSFQSWTRRLIFVAVRDHPKHEQRGASATNNLTRL